MSDGAWCCFCGNPNPKCGLRPDPFFGVPTCADQNACWAWGVRQARIIHLIRVGIVTTIFGVVAVLVLWFA